jgi:acetyl esterase
MPPDYADLREQRLAEVDAETREIYEVTGGGFGIREIGVEAFRELFAEAMGPEAGVLAPEVTASTISIPGPAGPIPTRVYLPEGEGPFGVYVHTHGGGWIAWNGLDHIDGFNSQLVREWGCAVVHPDFRVPPEDPFPAAVEDCWATIEWVGTHGDEIGVDSGRIAVGGGCTGANLAAVMALMARDAGGPRIALQFLDSPQLDTRADYGSQFEFAEGYGLTRDDDLCVIEHYLGAPENRWDWRASPVLVESVRGVAPALFTVGEYEILRDEALVYGGRLRDAGVDVHYLEGPAQGHSYLWWANLSTGEPTAVAAEHRAQVAAIVRRIIGAGSPSP